MSPFVQDYKMHHDHGKNLKYYYLILCVIFCNNPEAVCILQVHANVRRDFLNHRAKSFYVVLGVANHSTPFEALSCLPLSSW